MVAPYRDHGADVRRYPEANIGLGSAESGPAADMAKSPAVELAAALVKLADGPRM
jgi:hypothetical protein